jgi:hypothetical protein
MRVGPRLLLVLLAVSSTVVSTAVEANDVDWRVVQSFQQAIREADRRGDFQTAADQAEKCVAVTKAASTAPLTAEGNRYCAYYFISALRKGRGTPRDERRAFALLGELAAHDRDGDLALDMAEAYLDGVGTRRDPVEAGVLFWRVEHGAWSVYGDYWGMCENCKVLWNHMRVVEERVGRELTEEQKKRAVAIAAGRFPEIAARAADRDQQIRFALVCVFLVAFGVLWWRIRVNRQWYPRAR